MKCSNLNSDLFNLHVSDSPNCTFCNVMENSTHFIFDCPLYVTQRITLFSSVNIFCDVNLKKLLFGCNGCSDLENIQICNAFEHYIASSGRF